MTHDGDSDRNENARNDQRSVSQYDELYAIQWSSDHERIKYVCYF